MKATSTASFLLVYGLAIASIAVTSAVLAEDSVCANADCETGVVDDQLSFLQARKATATKRSSGDAHVGVDSLQFENASAFTGSNSTLAEEDLQGRAVQELLRGNDTNKDLVFIHVPFNFGHTIENVAALGGDSWGHKNPLVGMQLSNRTGCPLYMTPPKYWPDDVAEGYFGDKKVFGVLRDPFERLIAEFRGGVPNYGGSDPKFREACDVNGGIQQMLQSYKQDQFTAGCAFVPQVEYLEGKHGITLPIDNRVFPTSMNQVFKEHGYNEYISTEDILHVGGCDDVWAGDLTNETKSMIKEIYRADFDLLCTNFGHCNYDEMVCLQQVPEMCPDKSFHWTCDAKSENCEYERKDAVLPEGRMVAPLPANRLRLDERLSSSPKIES